MSNNINKEKISLSAIDTLTYEPALSTQKNIKGKEYISWGDNNQYPEYLYNIYRNSPTLNSVIDLCTKYTSGDGINLGVNVVNWENKEGDTFEDIINKIVIDRWIFGGFTLKIRFNNFGSIIGIKWVDFRNCRVSEDEQFVYISDSFGKWGAKAEKYSQYKPGLKDLVQVYYYKGKNTRNWYPDCPYFAALVNCEIEIETYRSNYQDIINGFTGSVLFNFNRGELSQEDISSIERSLTEKFTTRGSGARILISTQDGADKKTEIEPLPNPNNEERFESFRDSSYTSILRAFQMPHQLMGEAIQTGFSDIEYQNAFTLFKRTVIQPVQKEITNIFDKLFKVKDSITFIPFTINFDTTVEQPKIIE